jgi:hypothetical protein
MECTRIDSPHRLAFLDEDCTTHPLHVTWQPLELAPGLAGPTQLMRLMRLPEMIRVTASGGAGIVGAG